ncbi:MAG: protein-glutamate O-methyltransferase CheR [Gammaproteobacteria bacterium]|nr:protein-glutamate O-methyltransferase CheR [Gammaproteobacteria bacterium]
MSTAVSMLEYEVMKSDANEPRNKRAGSGLGAFPEMDDKQFLQWVDLLEQRTGMRLPDNRRSFLVTNLGIRMRELGYNSFQEYYELLHSGLGGHIEWDKLVHYLTVHETRFLRHEDSIALIREKYLPRHPWEVKEDPVTIHIWSVGCSTGEEPYSIAMAVDDHLKKLGCEFYLGIIASDISRSAIAAGRAGIYNKNQVKNIEPEWLKKYFEMLPDGRYQVIPELRQRVCFNQLNVINMEKTPIGAMDIIVCQNLLIYFDRARREQIVSNFVEHLTPGGLLVLGVGELVNWSHPKLERLNYANTLAFRHK